VFCRFLKSTRSNHVVRGERLLGSFSGFQCVVVGDLSVLLCVCVLDVIFYLFQFDVELCVLYSVTWRGAWTWSRCRQSHTDRFVTGVLYGIEIHVIAKYQYPCYRSPNGAEGFDKGGILGRYQSGMDQIKGTARAKIGQSCFQCNRVTSPWSRTSGGRTCSWVRFIILLSWSFFWFSSVNSICVCVYYCSTFGEGESGGHVLRETMGPVRNPVL
jgi:hypothetical protein